RNASASWRRLNVLVFQREHLPSDVPEALAAPGLPLRDVGHRARGNGSRAMVRGGRGRATPGNSLTRGFSGAGEGNRTLVSSLGSLRSTTEPRPRQPTTIVARPHTAMTRPTQKRNTARPLAAPASLSSLPTGPRAPEAAPGSP